MDNIKQYHNDVTYQKKTINNINDKEVTYLNPPFLNPFVVQNAEAKKYVQYLLKVNVLIVINYMIFLKLFILKLNTIAF